MSNNHDAPPGDTVQVKGTGVQGGGTQSLEGGYTLKLGTDKIIGNGSFVSPPGRRPPADPPAAAAPCFAPPGRQPPSRRRAAGADPFSAPDPARSPRPLARSLAAAGRATRRSRAAAPPFVRGRQLTLYPPPPPSSAALPSPPPPRAPRPRRAPPPRLCPCPRPLAAPLPAGRRLRGQDPRDGRDRGHQEGAAGQALQEPRAAGACACRRGAARRRAQAAPDTA